MVLLQYDLRVHECDAYWSIKTMNRDIFNTNWRIIHQGNDNAQKCCKAERIRKECPSLLGNIAFGGVGLHITNLRHHGANGKCISSCISPVWYPFTRWRIKSETNAVQRQPGETAKSWEIERFEKRKPTCKRTSCDLHSPLRRLRTFHWDWMKFSCLWDQWISHSPSNKCNQQPGTKNLR